MGKTPHSLNRMKKFILIITLLLLPLDVWANNLTIENVSITDPDDDNGTVDIEFDISWDNSWRNSVNYDAVWIFVKYSTDSGATWNHCTMYSGGANPSGYDDGTGTDIDFIVPLDKQGVIIERANVGAGSVSNDNVHIVWGTSNDNVSATDSARVQVFGVEMVFIPSWGFYLGDGDSSSESTYAFHVADNTAVSISTTQVDSVTVDTNANDDATLEAGIAIDGDDGIDTDGDNVVDNADWPVGRDAFYLMKYELSQGQYTEFLNNLTRTQQNSRTATDVSTDAITNVYVMIDASSSANRQVITCPASGNGTTDPITFSCTREDRAMNYVSWPDLCAWADWAGLRPYTELEFEKACRGPKAAIVGEYPWGNTLLTQATTISGSEDGTETITTENANCNVGNNTFTGGDAGTGPLRVGIFATKDSNRQLAGAGYYGNLDLAGNLYELTVTLGHSDGRGFEGSNGDGTLTTDGFGNNEDWPGYSVAASKISLATGMGRAGASFANANSNFCPTSDREVRSSSTETRQSYHGIRCAISRN